ncbi:uncharacterized protein LOC106068145 isoform X2 [Biomphalaria glabrata]|uniref:Uncharacterized protein LOC106068145 isoform X2 n=1 Tax=Biomphalaria glabrata TaxID=6526 RepID=A0A9W2YXX7_BIOGL|nr:uncharacterized protein LOC106068145 isoform X2 [Biomphalaria glabrata]
MFFLIIIWIILQCEEWCRIQVLAEYCEKGAEYVNNICTDCDIGFYKELPGNDSCTKCPPGYTTLGTGSTSNSSCNILHCEQGFFSRDNISCSICPNGTYKNLTGNQPCVKCPMNTTTPRGGGTDIKDCSLDCPTICIPNDPCKYTGTSSCVCPTGYYGQHCSKRCSPGCLNDSCHKVNGKCDCKEGYYGDKCLKTGMLDKRNKWTSHCKSNGSEEKRFKSDHCSIGWFGESCQYRDLGVLAIMDYKVLNDNNDRTCVKQNSVRILWNHEIQTITWIRLVFQSNDADEIAIHYYDEMLKSTTLVCGPSDLRYHKYGNTSIDFNCEYSYFSGALLITWQSDSPLCSVRISGERNMATAARQVRWKHRRKSWTPIETLNDGYYSNTGCLIMNSSITLEFDFWNDIFSFQIILFTDFSREDGHGTFSVQLLDSVEDLVFNISTRGKDVFVQKAIFGAIYSFRTVYIRVLSGTLHLCEVEIYGDCQKPYYGPTCQDICYLSCLDQVCTYEGECFSCVPGHSGIYCQDRNDSDYVTLAARATAEADDSSHTEDYSLKNIYIAMLIQMVLLMCVLFIGNKYFSAQSNPRADAAFLSRGPSKL